MEAIIVQCFSVLTEAIALYSVPASFDITEPSRTRLS